MTLRKRGDVRMSQTQSEAAVMEQTAAKFEQTNEQLQQMLNGLLNELSVLESEWRGQGAMSFTQVKQEWSENQAKMARALAETATAVRTAGQNYTASDTEAASRVTKINAGMDLPL